MSRLNLRVDVEKWPLKAPFRISGYTMVELDVIVVTLEQNGCVGRGEAAGVYYLHDDVPSMLARIEAVRPAIEADIDRDSLQRLLPPGGARNAVDCALWDLDSKRLGRPAWQLAGLATPQPLLTTYTLGADSPQNMAAGAKAYDSAKLLKLKLIGEAADADRIRAVREARPDALLTVDANQGFSRALLQQLQEVLTGSKVALVEQPLPRGQEDQLDGLDFPIPLAADESVQGLSDLAALPGRFDVVNIKLDKCGGLTEALAMAREARRLGLDVMVGNMAGTTLATAPAFLVGQLCRFVDLDGPLLLRSDRPQTVSYGSGMIWCPEAAWGGIESL